MAKVKDHLINNGRKPAFRVWRGPGARDSSDDEWEQEFKIPSGAHDGQFDAKLDMEGMVEDAFQQCDELTVPVLPLEEQLEDIVMDAFTITDELANVGVDQSEVGKDDKPLGDNGCSTPEEENHDDPCVSEEAMEELYHGAKSSVLQPQFDNDFVHDTWREQQICG